MSPGLKTGVENDIFWSEIELGFGEPAITGRYTPPRIPKSTPRDLTVVTNYCNLYPY